MLSPFKGETVTVFMKDVSGYDELGNPTMTETPQEVDNVLVAVGSQGEPGETNRPEGVNIAYTLYLPKAFTSTLGEDTLDNREVEVRGHRCRVVGHPDIWPSPNPWDMACEVENVEG